MANRFYTIMIVPEKSSQVRKILIPAWLARGAILGGLFLVALAGIMLTDYAYVMSQIDENKELKLENRRLRQQVQIFKNRVVAIETTMDRLKTFATRLKIITNIEERGNPLQAYKDGKLPLASQNTGIVASVAPDTGVSEPTAGDPRDPQEILLKKDVSELNDRFRLLTEESMNTEHLFQDLYELLADQKAFLLALPTRKPAIGYVTSGFGVRPSPYGGRVKMHEGIDIANFPGTAIKAPADATVSFANTKPGYGKTVILDHGYGLETWYAHTQKITVKEGDKVRRGELIALLGNSGRSTGPHLHYEVRVNGYPVNPLTYILEN